MSKSYVVGKTDEREVYVASLHRAFVLNEYLIIDDIEHNLPVGEIIETNAYNEVTDETFSPKSGIKLSLDKIYGYDNLENKKVYIGKLKLLKEYHTPIVPHSELKLPSFDEIGDLLVNTTIDKGFTLGVINGTRTLYDKLPSEIKNIAPLYENRQIVEQDAVPFLLDFRSFKEYPHMGFFGGSGSGKTFGLRVACEEIMQKGIPAIAFDPHFEFDFSEAMDGLPHYQRFPYQGKYELFQIGENVGINFAELSTSEILSLLEFIGDLSQPMRGAIETLHEKNDSFTTLATRINNLKKAFENMEKKTHERENLSSEASILYAKYKDKVAGAMTLQGVSWRLDQLEKTGLFKYDVKLVENALLNRKLAVVRGSQMHLKMIASYLIGKMYRK